MGNLDGGLADLVSAPDPAGHARKREMLSVGPQGFCVGRDVPADDTDGLKRYPLRTRALIIVGLVGGLWAIIWFLAQSVWQVLA
ncbi:MAG TPA: hypothetical protein VMU82_14430 [Acetobacteraceae bacterium]|nr:hypothetical protein [Acetobacteraceae bacterium]